MDKLACLNAFVSVVESTGFSAAARRLRVSKALISKQVNQLEEQLGVRLLHRTTRSVQPTSAGQAYYEQCRPLLDELHQLDASVQSSDQSLRGSLRISAPITFAEMHLMPVISDFCLRYPEVNIELDLTDHFINLAEERVDMAIRIGELESSSLVSRKLGHITMRLCATADYLQRYGHPESLQALAQHRCIVDSNHPDGDHWRLFSQGREETVRVREVIRVNNPSAARQLVLAGNGIGFLPSFAVDQQIEQGHLLALLDQYHTQAIGIYAVYLHRKHLSPKVRKLLDLMVASLAFE